MENDADLRGLLETIHTIAVVGIKSGEADDAFRVPRYMQGHGYRVVPVNPKLTEVLGESAWPSLRDIDQPVDLVNVFRAPAFVPAHAEEVLAMDPLPRCVWLQLGIRHEEAARELERAGVAVVQDRCLMIEHRRLLGER